MQTFRTLAPLMIAGFATAQSGYLVDSNLDQLFSVDLSTGAATFIASTANNGLGTPADLSYNIATGELWTIDLSGGEVGTIDTTNGTFTPVYQTNLSGWQGMAWDLATQKFYLANQNDNTYELDPATGQTTLLGDSTFDLIACMDTDANGNLYGIDFFTGFVVQVDKTTGIGTMLSTTSAGFQGLGIHQGTGVWYGANTNDDSLHNVDPNTGTNNVIGSHGSGVVFAKGFDLIDAGANFATKTLFGEGCYSTYASFFESYTSTSPFDLSNMNLEATYAVTGYVVLTIGTSPWFTPTSGIAINDDQVVSQALGFTMPYPGGTTSTIGISSNGFVWLGQNTANGCCSGSTSGMLTGGDPRWAALWNDLNPAAGGTVYVDNNTAAGSVVVTFENVPRFGTQDLNTFQYEFSPSGNVTIRYQQCNLQTSTTVVGFSPGNNNANPGETDISATPVIITEPDMAALAINADNRPVIGTTINITVDNIPAGAAIGAVIYGLAQFNPGLDLSSIGMPGCSQYCSQDSVVLGISPGASFTDPFTIPNDPGLASVIINCQGASYAPGAINNALGANSSNGMELFLDIN